MAREGDDMSFTTVLDVIAAIVGIGALSAVVTAYVLRPRRGQTAQARVAGFAAGVLVAVCLALVIASLTSAQMSVSVAPTATAKSTGTSLRCVDFTPCPSATTTTTPTTAPTTTTTH